MTANEMKFSFQMKFDSLFDFSAPEYDDRHISYILTEAEHRVFIRRYNPRADKYQKGFESDEQRRRDLEQLLRPVKIAGNIETGASRTYECVAGSYIMDINTIGLYPGMSIDIPDVLTSGTLVTAIVSDTQIRLSKPVIATRLIGSYNRVTFTAITDAFSNTTPQDISINGIYTSDIARLFGITDMVDFASYIASLSFPGYAISYTAGTNYIDIYLETGGTTTLHI